MSVLVKSRMMRLALDRNCLSQKELAERLGLSPGYVSQIVSGARPPSPRVRRGILEVLDGVGFDQLFEVRG
jgi:transcriptional regulator with XRE-family HTH domain